MTLNDLGFVVAKRAAVGAIYKLLVSAMFLFIESLME